MTTENLTQEEIEAQEAAAKAAEAQKVEDEPMWKTMGYESLDDMIIQNEVGKAEASTRSKMLADELAKPRPSGPIAPVFDQKRFEDEGDAYLVQHQSDVHAFGQAVQVQATAPAQTTEIDKQAAIEGVLAAADFQKINRHTVYAYMDSMAKTAEFAPLGQTPDGIKRLGRMAMEELKKAAPAKKEVAPEKTITPKKGGPATPVIEDGATGEVLRQKAIEEAQKKGNESLVTQLRALKGQPVDVITETTHKLLPSLKT